MSKIMKYMSNKSRIVLLSENKNTETAGCSTTSQRACQIEKKNVNDVNDVNYTNDVNDVIDLNSLKLDSCLGKISSHDLPYKGRGTL